MTIFTTEKLGELTCNNTDCFFELSALTGTHDRAIVKVTDDFIRECNSDYNEMKQKIRKIILDNNTKESVLRQDIRISFNPSKSTFAAIEWGPYVLGNREELRRIFIDSPLNNDKNMQYKQFSFMVNAINIADGEGSVEERIAKINDLTKGMYILVAGVTRFCLVQSEGGLADGNTIPVYHAEFKDKTSKQCMKIIHSSDNAVCEEAKIKAAALLCANLIAVYNDGSKSTFKDMSAYIRHGAEVLRLCVELMKLVDSTGKKAVKEIGDVNNIVLCKEAAKMFLDGRRSYSKTQAITQHYLATELYNSAVKCGINMPFDNFNRFAKFLLPEFANVAIRESRKIAYAYSIGMQIIGGINIVNINLFKRAIKCVVVDMNDGRAISYSAQPIIKHLESNDPNCDFFSIISKRDMLKEEHFELSKDVENVIAEAHANGVPNEVIAKAIKEATENFLGGSSNE